MVVVFATWNDGVHQEFYAPRILYAKICALLSGHNLGVVFGVLGVLGVFGVLGVLGVLHVLGASLYWG